MKENLGKGVQIDLDIDIEDKINEVDALMEAHKYTCFGLCNFWKIP